MTRAGFGLVDTATVTPSGNVHVGPVVCPDGKPTTTRSPEFVCRASNRVERAYISARLVASSHLAEDECSRSCEETTQRQLGHHAIDPVRALADFFEEQDAPFRRIERERSTE